MAEPTAIFYAACQQKSVCEIIEDEVGVVLDAADLWQIIRICEKAGIIPSSE